MAMTEFEKKMLELMEREREAMTAIDQKLSELIRCIEGRDEGVPLQHVLRKIMDS